MHITTTPFYDIPKQTSNMPWQKGHFNHLFLVAKFTQYTCSSLHIKVVYICKVCYSSSSNQKVWKHQKAIMRIYDSTIPKSVKIRIFWNWVILKNTNGFYHFFTVQVSVSGTTSILERIHMDIVLIHYD